MIRLQKILFSLSFASIAIYATVPTSPVSVFQAAGIVERELQKQYEPNPIEQERSVPELKIDLPGEPLKLIGGTQTPIVGVILQGNESFSCEEIWRWIWDRATGDLSQEDIGQICTTIDQNYAKRGYFLARSYPPMQVIKDRLLVIQIEEGRLGNVKIEGNHRYPTSFIQKYFSRLQAKPLCYDDFMRALLLLNEHSDLSASATFTKGKKPGTADLTIFVKDRLPLHLNLNANNYGRKLTTNFTSGVRFDAGSLVRYGDTLSIAEVIGFPMKALYFTDVKYSIPLTVTGAFLEFDYLYTIFDVQELRDFRPRGKAAIYTLQGSYALTRKEHLRVDLQTSFAFKQIQNFALGSQTSYDRLRVYAVGFIIDHADSYGRDYLNLQTKIGIPDFLGGLGATGEHSSNPPAGGRFIAFNVDYDRFQPVQKDCFLSFHGSGQYSPYNLTVPEQIYIGGGDSVRGFPLAAALGNSGYYANLEARIPPPFLAHYNFLLSKKKWKEVLQIVGFFDQGAVFPQSGPNVFLFGTGLGFRVKGPGSLSLTIDIGFPLNHPNLSSGTFTYIKLTGHPF